MTPPYCVSNLTEEQEVFKKLFDDFCFKLYMRSFPFIVNILNILVNINKTLKS